MRTGKAESVAATTGRHVIDDIAVSPDGKLLATGHHDGFVCLRDPATGAVRKEWQAHEPGQVTWGVSFGPGGIWLATAGDRTVKVWDTLTGTLLRKFEGHTSRAWSAKFSRDGRTLLSTSLDLTGYVWEVPPALGQKDRRTTEQLWDDLNGKPEAAFRAVWLAAADPQTPEFFGKKLALAAEAGCGGVQEAGGGIVERRVPGARGGREGADGVRPRRDRPGEEGPRGFRFAGGADAARSGDEGLDGVGIRPGGLAPQAHGGGDGAGRHRGGAQAPGPLGRGRPRDDAVGRCGGGVEEDGGEGEVKGAGSGQVYPSRPVRARCFPADLVSTARGHLQSQGSGA